MTLPDVSRVVSEERPERGNDEDFDVRNDLLKCAPNRETRRWRSLAERYIDHDTGVHVRTRIKPPANLGPVADYCAVYERADMVGVSVELRSAGRGEERADTMQNDARHDEMTVFVDVIEIAEDAERAHARPMLSVVRLQALHHCQYAGMHMRQPTPFLIVEPLAIVANQELDTLNLLGRHARCVPGRQGVRDRVEGASEIVNNISCHQAPIVGHWLRGANAHDVLAPISVVLNVHWVAVRAQKISKGLLYDLEVPSCPV